MTNIVMLCHGRLRLLEQSIESLFDHTPDSEFNLTLVADQPMDFRISRFLERAVVCPNATLLTIDKSAHVLARAKNIGVAWSEQTFSRGDWLYLSDSDVYFTPGWLPKMIAHAEDSELEGFRLWGGQAHPFHKPVGEPWIGNGGKVLRDLAVLDGPSWLLRWDSWRHWGPFNPNCVGGVCQSEEYEICTKIRTAKGNIGVLHPPVVYHTGLTNSDGKDAPGRVEREAQRVEGVLYK